MESQVQAGSETGVLFPGNRIPVGVIMTREEGQSGRWSFARWQALGVVVGESLGQDGVKKTLVRCEDERQEYLWSGLELRLYRDSAETYWFNLTGERPALYVVCQEDDEGGKAPMLVTADFDEAAAYEEGGDEIFSVPMPPEVRQWLERFVVDHYKPAQKKKRRRKNWKESEEPS